MNNVRKMTPPGMKNHRGYVLSTCLADARGGLWSVPVPPVRAVAFCELMTFSCLLGGAASAGCRGSATGSGNLREGVGADLRQPPRSVTSQQCLAAEPAS